MAEVTTINTQNFKMQVLDTGGKTIVEFFANWCPDCRVVEPLFREVAKEISEGISFFRLDIQENPEKAQEYEVKHIPHFIVFEDGEKMREATELRNKEQILQLINGER